MPPPEPPRGKSCQLLEKNQKIVKNVSEIPVHLFLEAVFALESISESKKFTTRFFSTFSTTFVSKFQSFSFVKEL